MEPCSGRGPTQTTFILYQYNIYFLHIKSVSIFFSYLLSFVLCSIFQWAILFGYLYKNINGLSTTIDLLYDYT